MAVRLCDFAAIKCCLTILNAFYIVSCCEETHVKCGTLILNSAHVSSAGRIPLPHWDSGGRSHTLLLHQPAHPGGPGRVRQLSLPHCPRGPRRHCQTPPGHPLLCILHVYSMSSTGSTGGVRGGRVVQSTGGWG